MYICFAEYRIAEESRLPFLELTNKLLQHEKDMYLYEGTDQPNLFVEVWHAATSAEAEQIKKERCSERSSWSQVSSYIVGGQAKLHVWTFKSVYPKKPDCG
ncbi:hypothetical protein FHS16_000787 [Paenibacillus endophyticus]|uniref:NIPSNAP domain-containing protein n=1 Tax=Paenibacillus endophyticus TaxID=1294268 RepID=A0A7W5C3W3_9BACL|nr:hypothetical protein [Paenibacillus endophyticus]MBB3150753.1 hypothetical protein [Paenibacillus endophyticus]